MGNQLLLSEEYLRLMTDDASEAEQTQAALASIVRASADAIISLSSNGRVTSWSPGAERLYGIGAVQMLGRAPAVFFREDIFLRDGCRRDPVAQDGDSVRRYEARHFRSNGTALEVAVALSPIRDCDDAMVGVVAVISDLSERKRAALELTRAQAAAQEAARLKAAILSNISHEIRTPLNIILGYAEVINDYFAGQGDASQSDALDAIMRAGDRLCTTIQEVLDISKIEAGHFETRPVRIELDRLLGKQLPELAAAARRKGLEFECLIERPGVAVMFDEYCLTRALATLVDNAIKFTPRGKVSARLYVDSHGSLCLEVRDSGIGIAPRHLARLFEPFSQEQAGSDRGFEGMGLGLSLCRRYLELNGALVSVESTEGAGSAFTIRFRSYEQALRVRPAAAASAGPTPRRAWLAQFSY
ncbi:MAG TPA: PAS domain-containing sensor histidine kinase [Candidatus Binataceae bacterium]|nr:PAS domain-containing sensor histidine kinase [Candidatus Binataceae bacterium]